MWTRILVAVKRNKLVFFSFAALVTFSLTLVSVNVERLTMSDNRTTNSTTINNTTIIYQIVSHDSVPALKHWNTLPLSADGLKKETVSASATVSQPVPEESVVIQVDEYHFDRLKKSEPSKLYRFVLNEPRSVRVIFTNKKTINADASVYCVDVLNAEKASVINGELKVPGIAGNFETGYIYLEAGTYYIKVSQGSIPHSGSYRLWVRTL